MGQMDDTFGANFVSALASCFACGITCAMCFDYFLRFQSDRIAFKLLVGFLLVSTFAHAALISSQAYKLLITNYANPAFIMVLPVQITTEMGILGVNCFVVQAFFLWRLYVLSERKAWAWTGFAALLSLVSWAITMYLVDFLRPLTSMLDFVGVFPTGYVWLACTATCDVMITLGMSYYLFWKPRKNFGGAIRSGSSGSSPLMRILLRSLQTNILSLIWQLILTVLFVLGSKAGFWYSPFTYTVSMVYTFSLLVSLNARRGTDNQFVGVGSFQTTNNGTKVPPRSNGMMGGISVVQDTHIDNSSDANVWQPAPVSVRFDGNGRVDAIDRKYSPDSHEMGRM